jgi:xylulokinase
MIEIGTQIENIRLVGGAATNPIWNQIHADILEHPVTTLHVADAAMVGAAVCAAMGVGLYEDWSKAADCFVQIKDTIDPQPINREVYEQSYQNYRDAFLLLSHAGIFRRL